MRIQNLKIFGFKSFAQKVEIPFEGNGLTAILGPNGCGKSNIVDAIRWVMGEQRPGLLRMDKMQGVIFSGTAERPALSMAEVSLVIENDRGLLPSEFSEVMITRKAFSNGESEYYINNQECRLTDIKNLFVDKGMGSGSYSQMDQRMVDAVLSDKADERRTIFEEAAGVSKYKKQRKDAAAQLERAEADMERISFELQHAKNQFKQQERMLTRAQEQRKLRDRLKELDVSVSIGKYAEGKASLHAISKAKTNSETELGALNTKQTELETKIEEKRLLISSDEENFRESEKEFYAADAEVKKQNSDYVNIQNRERELEENESRCENEISENKGKILELNTEMQGLEEIEESGKKETDALLSLRNAVENLRKRHRELSNKRLHSVQEQGKLQSERQAISTETKILSERIQTAEKELQNLDVQIQERELLKNNKENSVEENRRESEIFAERINVLTNEKDALSETLESLKKQRIELETLQKSAGENAGGLDGNKWLLKQKSNEGISLLSSQIEVLESKYAALIEFCLNFSMQAMLVQNKETVLNYANTLNKEHLGRALLAWNVNLAEEKINLGEADVKPLSSFIKHNPLSNFLLSKYFLVKDLETAFDLSQKYAGRDFWFCTENCQAVSSFGLARVGLEQREKIKIIDEQISVANKKLQELSALISSTAEEKRSADTHIIKETSEAEFASASILALEAQKEKIEQDISTFETRLQELKNSANSNAELNTAGLEFEQAENEFLKIDGELQEQEQALKKQEDLVARLASAINQIRTINNAIVLREGELAEIRSKKESLKNELEYKAIQIEKQNEILAKKESLRDAARERYTVMAGDIEDWRSSLKEINSSLREKDKNAHNLELAMQESSNAQSRIRERIFQEYEFDLEKEPAEQGFTPVQTDEREANVEMHDLRNKIKDIGPVNAFAAEDFEAEKERMLSIETQYRDLEKTKNSLLTAMEKLDLVARDRFLDTFRKIQRNYQDIFSTLMPGGEALLSMQSDLDPLEAEIMINARPPGKKMMGVRALSGGERALTATSLLFALYKVKPSPYCILDEIDGPLDDANIRRFIGLLRSFSDQTQFVLITHNKSTMAACDKLYGVTQEIKGISMVASVRLEDVPDKN